jgi:hypothetical protein
MVTNNTSRKILICLVNNERRICPEMWRMEGNKTREKGRDMGMSRLLPN